MPFFDRGDIRIHYQEAGSGQPLQVSLYPWKDPPELIPLTVRPIRTFLRAHGV